MGNSPSNLRPNWYLYGLWHDCHCRFNWQQCTNTLIQYTLSFYIQVGLVTCFIIAFLFLKNKKLDSRRKLSEEIVEPMLENINRDSLLTAAETE